MNSAKNKWTIRLNRRRYQLVIKKLQKVKYKVNNMCKSNIVEIKGKIGVSNLIRINQQSI